MTICIWLEDRLGCGRQPARGLFPGDFVVEVSQEATTQETTHSRITKQTVRKETS